MPKICARLVREAAQNAFPTGLVGGQNQQDVVGVHDHPASVPVVVDAQHLVARIAPQRGQPPQRGQRLGLLANELRQRTGHSPVRDLFAALVDRQAGKPAVQLGHVHDEIRQRSRARDRRARGHARARRRKLRVAATATHSEQRK